MGGKARGGGHLAGGGGVALDERGESGAAKAALDEVVDGEERLQLAPADDQRRTLRAHACAGSVTQVLH